MKDNGLYEKPLVWRFMLWVHERFPLPNAPFFVLLFIVAYAVAASSEKREVIFSWNIIIGCLLSWSYFLLLRIFDEHKDYLIDCEHHPQRVLQRGLITLKHLKFVGAGCIALQLFASMAIDGGIAGATLAWVLLFAWTCLMGKEFFIGQWLNQYLTCYAISHMLVMPLIILWLANIAVPGVTLSAPMQILMLLSFTAGFIFEITRKFKGPDEDRQEIPTYSSIYGIKTIFIILNILISVMLLIQLGLIMATIGNVPFLSLIPLVIFYILTLYQLVTFLHHPYIRNRKRNEAIVGLYLAVGYLVCAITILNSIIV
ncbi:UbiA family prenyltransferase [Serratia sp. PL7]|uniref:UbiA family prenyltransferase n=1 Tax=Serratia sp. PL7 TaxID=2952201 RepID=UPI001A088849|nr:UbiA family prenyltransferase [Serratia sp. PL7]MBE0148094.1 prenyltransferase [Serratia fonticola]